MWLAIHSQPHPPDSISHLKHRSGMYCGADQFIAAAGSVIGEAFGLCGGAAAIQVVRFPVKGGAANAVEGVGGHSSTQAPSIVSLSPQVHGPHISTARTIGLLEQTMHSLNQMASNASSFSSPVGVSSSFE